MARILILTLVFPPDSVSTAILLGDLALDLRDFGHDITVLTTTPHYNIDSESVNAQPLHPCWGGQVFKSEFKGIPVFHVRIPKKGKRIGARLLDYLRFHAISTLVGLVLTAKYDLILAPSPPLTVGVSAWLLGRFRRIPFIYNVQEIYPDVAVSLGVLRNNLLIKAMLWLERFIYARSRIIIVISEWFHRRLLAKGVAPWKLRVISNFVDTDFIQPGNRLNDFAKRYDLEDKFTVLYAGNIGLTQNFENILSASQRLRHLQDLVFVVIGDGARRSWLEQKLSSGYYPNVMMLPYQPRSAVPSIYATSDVCLVPLKGGTAQETFPSKIYTIMAAGRPAITAADHDSELAWVTREAGCGWAVPPDDDVALANAIKQAYHQRAQLQEMGRLGRRYVVKHHSRKVIARRYDQLVREVVAGRQMLK